MFRAYPTQTIRPIVAWLRLVLALIIALTALLHGGWARSVAADVEGNTYTSPQYGYTVTWDDTWFVVEEESGDFDLLTVTNGLTYASFVAGPDTSPNPESALAGVVTEARSDPTVSDFAPLRDSAGNAIRDSDERHAFAAFTFTQEFEDGSTMALAAYFETRPVTAGSVYLFFSAYMPKEDFASERPQFELLLGGLVMPGEEGAAQAAGEQVVTGGQQVLANGEPAPVFVSGQWRVGIAAAALNEALEGVGLKEKAGKQWLVMVLDVTNWSEIDAQLSVEDFKLGSKGATKPSKIAPASTSKVAEVLNLAAPSDDQSMAIGAGETARVALVFLLPAQSQAPALIIGKEALPLTDTLEGELQPDGLPAPAGPPEVQSGKIVSAPNGKTLRIQLDGESTSQAIQLLGVDPPAKGECFAHEAKKLLDDMVGTVVLVEDDAALKSGKTPARYVWLTNDDGTRTLLNQRLIAEGKVEAASIPDDARFGSWFEVSERAAETAQAGLWTTCSSPKSATRVPTTSSTTSPTPRPTSTPVVTDTKSSGSGSKPTPTVER
jgi:hypothetical protein